MHPISEAWLEHRARRWLRPDADRWVRPDAHRWFRPDGTRWSDVRDDEAERMLSNRFDRRWLRPEAKHSHWQQQPRNSPHPTHCARDAALTRVGRGLPAG